MKNSKRKLFQIDKIFTIVKPDIMVKSEIRICNIPE
jgi:hypothetical protein